MVDVLIGTPNKAQPTQFAVGYDISSTNTKESSYIESTPSVRNLSFYKVHLTEMNGMSPTARKTVILFISMLVKASENYI